MKTTVVLVDDHQIVRDGLRSLLEREHDIKVVGEAATGREALQLTRQSVPDVVIMDVMMPDLNGVEATRQIRAHHPDVKIIALSMHDDRKFVAEMLTAGAAGYLLKDCTADELAAAIRTVVTGRTYLSGRIATTVVDELKRTHATAIGSTSATLTPREREVLQLFAEGKGTKDIATLLHVSIPTVETHRKRIMDKLNIYNIADLTKYAIREGLTSLDGTSSPRDHS